MLARTLIVALCLATAAAVLPHASDRETMPLREPLSSLPLELAGWHGRPDVEFDEEIVRMLGVDEYVNRVYKRAGTVLGLYIGYYSSQREGATIHSPQHCLPGAGWRPISRDRLSLRSAAGIPFEASRYLIEKGSDRQVAFYWYEGRGRSVASEYRNKLWLLWDAVRTGRTEGALVRILVPLHDREQAAERNAVEFTQALHSVVRRSLPD